MTFNWWLSNSASIIVNIVVVVDAVADVVVVVVVVVVVDVVRTWNGIENLISGLDPPRELQRSGGVRPCPKIIGSMLSLDGFVPLTETLPLLLPRPDLTIIIFFAPEQR